MSDVHRTYRETKSWSETARRHGISRDTVKSIVRRASRREAEQALARRAHGGGRPPRAI